MNVAPADRADRLPVADYGTSVFINCPFDAGFKPLLNAIVFCVVRSGFKPRLASERIDSGENRIGKIMGMIEQSRFGIHDLSRSQSRTADELARHNMPLELGLDLGCRRYGAAHHRDKIHLVLEERAYRHQAAISDLAGCDPVIHGGKAKRALSAVRDFLDPHAATQLPGPSELWGEFGDFQAVLFTDLAARGFSKADIRGLRIAEYITHAQAWTRTV